MRCELWILEEKETEKPLYPAWRDTTCCLWQASPEAHLKMSLMYSSAVRPSSAMKMSAILGTIDALPLRAAGLIAPML